VVETREGLRFGMLRLNVFARGRIVGVGVAVRTWKVEDGGQVRCGKFAGKLEVV
jgi:hypothetical protein